MRQMTFATYVLVFCLSSSETWAQNCKPDVSKEDKISRERLESWSQVLSAPGIGKSLVGGPSEETLTATIGRSGNVNTLSLQLQHSTSDASVKAAYPVRKGAPFYFAFAKGDPVTFKVTEVARTSGVQQGLFAAKGVVTVVLSATLQDADLASLRETLTSRQIETVRIETLNARIDKSVSAGDGRKMMEKLSCFYQFLDKRGIKLTASVSPDSQPVPSVAGGDVGCPSAPVPFAKVMMPAFAADFEKCTVATSVQFVAAGQSQVFMLHAIPKSAVEGRIAFRVLSPGEAEFAEGPLTGVLPHVFIAKAASDLVFELKRGDAIVVTGHPVMGKMKVGGREYIEVIFVADSLRRADR